MQKTLSPGLHVMTEDEAARFMDDPAYVVVQSRKSGLLPQYGIQAVLDRTWEDERRSGMRQETWERYRRVSMDQLRTSSETKRLTNDIISMVDAGRTVVIAVPEYRGFNHSARRLLAEWFHANGVGDIDTGTGISMDHVPMLPACTPDDEAGTDRRDSERINAGRAAFLKPGLLLSDGNGGLFVYLGYYDGRLPSVNREAREGYLYVGVWPWDVVKGGPDDATDDDILNCRQGLRANLSPGCFEDWCHYVRNPKWFKERYRVVDLSPVMADIRSLHGLVRVGDGKPKRK